MGRIDMTGWVMKEHGVPDSRLTVLYETSKRQEGSIIWHCKCECGNECDIRGENLRSGKTKSCGCYSKKINMAGWIMKEHGVPDSKITVLYELPERKNKRIYWHCKCECGNECDIVGSSIRNGETKTCGCLQKEITAKRTFIDLKNQRFGKLVAIEPTNKRNYNGSVIWRCKCDCGNECEVCGDYLRNGDTKSCGCLKSKGELKITQLLQKHNILFEQQKFFDDCKFIDTNRFAYFDFYVDNKYIIEFDGEQHIMVKSGYFNGEEGLKHRQEHDKIKNQYCFKHNIPIIRIPYKHLDNIILEDLVLETSKFLLKQEE